MHTLLILREYCYIVEWRIFAEVGHNLSRLHPSTSSLSVVLAFVVKEELEKCAQAVCIRTSSVKLLVQCNTYAGYKHFVVVCLGLSLLA